MRISDWSSDVCSSDLHLFPHAHPPALDRGVIEHFRLQPENAIAHRRIVLEIEREFGEAVFDLEPQRMPGIVRHLAEQPIRSEELRVGKECVSQWRSRLSPEH